VIEAGTTNVIDEGEFLTPDDLGQAERYERSGKGHRGREIGGERLQIHKPPVCEICGEVVHGRRLHIHHKDKNRRNNDLNNLQVVCVSCHNNVIHKRKRDELGRFTNEEVV